MSATSRHGFSNPLDAAIKAIAPRWALRRLEARSRMARVELGLRRYDGAGSGRRLRGWNTSNGSQNAEALTGLSKLRSRSRDLARNNSWGRRAVKAWANNVVGHGIVPTFQVPGSKSLGDDIGRMFEDWATSTQPDPEERLTFYGLQSLGTSEIVEAGEVLFRYRVRRTSDGLPFPLQIQPLEADHLDDTKTSAIAVRNRRVIQGVEYGPIGNRIAYHLFKDHPGEVAYPIGFESTRVPARQVLHVFRPDRMGQARGIPWGSACILTLRDFDSFVDAQLMRQKIAAMFVGFVTSTDPDDMANTVENPDDATELDGQQDFEPGTWEHLPLGRDITFSKPPPVEEFGEYSTVTLRQVAAGYGVPYEVLTGDLSNVNFHSGRLGRMDFASEVDAFRRLYLIPQFCLPVVRRFLTIAVLSGRLPEQANTASITWTPPAPKLIEPGREIRAKKDAVRAGFQSRSSVIRELGGVPEQVFREIAEEEKKLRALDLEFSDTPMPPDADELRDQVEDQQNGDAETSSKAPKGKAEIDLSREPA